MFYKSPSSLESQALHLTISDQLKQGEVRWSWYNWGNNSQLIAGGGILYFVLFYHVYSHIEIH